MRRVASFGGLGVMVGALGCNPIEVGDSPFDSAVTTATTTSPPMDGSSGDPGTTSDDPTATSASGTTNDPDPEPDSSGGAPPMCGNGVREGDEVCDGDDFGELSCESEGFTEGVLACEASCQSYSTAGCFICGNGMVEPAEGCDGGLPPGVTCASEGFTEGTIDCDVATCQLITSGCSLCGNGAIEGAEPCDQNDFGGLGCTDLGFTGGNLACDATCVYDLSGCSGGMYVQDFEGGAALPAEFGTSGNAAWIVDSGNPIAGIRSAASGTITHNQITSLTLDTSFAVAGTVAFTHEESSEGSFDYLQFYVDGVQQQQWSGINAAQMASYPVAAGNHTFEWRYDKDGSVNSGSDRVWVDDIVLTGGAPI